jgi:hypothetical protein
MRTEMLRHLGRFTTPETTAGTATTKRLFMGFTAGSDTISRPLEFSWHDYAVFLLSMAAEIEHSLMVQYLYAAWSLGGPAVPVAHQADVLTQQRIILGIAKEEMGHLITVQNVLRLVGGQCISTAKTSTRTHSRWTRPPRSRWRNMSSPKAPSTGRPRSCQWKKDRIEQLARTDAGMQVRRVGELYQTLITILDNPDRLPDRLFLAHLEENLASASIRLSADEFRTLASL